MKQLAVWCCLCSTVLAATNLWAQTVPATGNPPPYIKAVPQTERKSKPERVDELAPYPLHPANEAPVALPEKAERSARRPRGVSNSHGVRSPHIDRHLGPRGPASGH
jgi:hypothetical protein